MMTMIDATLRARVRAAVSKVGLNLREWHTDTITDAVLAAIPEPAPVVRSHKCSTGGVTITYTAGAGWDRPLYPGVRKRLLQVIPAGASDDDLAACLALRDGVDTKDAQIAALTQRAEAADARCMELENLVRMTNTCCADAYTYRDTQSRIIAELEAELAALTQRADAAKNAAKHGQEAANSWCRKATDANERAGKAVAERNAIEAELAALKAKASTPTWWVNVYDDNQVVIHSTEARARNGAVAAVKRVAVPLYEAVP